MARSKRLIGKVGIKCYEELAYGLDLFRIPMLKKQQEKAIRQSFHTANIIAKRIGEKPKVYKRITERNIIEEIT